MTLLCLSKCDKDCITKAEILQWMNPKDFTQKKGKSHCVEAPHGNSHYFGRIELDTVSSLKQLVMQNCTPSLPHV